MASYEEQVNSMRPAVRDVMPKEGVLHPAFVGLLTLTDGVKPPSSVVSYADSIAPGPLQPPEYSRAMADGYVGEVSSPETLGAAINVRQVRATDPAEVQTRYFVAERVITGALPPVRAKLLAGFIALNDAAIQAEELEASQEPRLPGATPLPTVQLHLGRLPQFENAPDGESHSVMGVRDLEGLHVYTETGPVTYNSDGIMVSAGTSEIRLFDLKDEAKVPLVGFLHSLHRATMDVRTSTDEFRRRLALLQNTQ